ncbi:MAG TPA: hypothetical protein VKB76_13580, partial [Ktedonobacterales bacterium]|nr:hypothetical protein [Ktedonobacterales bacterium]
MYPEIAAFFQQIMDLHADIQSLIATLGALSGGQRQELEAAHAKITSLQDSFDRLTGRALLVTEQNLFAQATFGLDRVDDLIHALTSWNVTLQQMHDTFTSEVKQSMSFVPSAVWNEMSRYYYSESISDIDRYGPGSDGRIGWIWDRYGLLDVDSVKPGYFQYASTHG